MLIETFVMNAWKCRNFLTHYCFCKYAANMTSTVYVMFAEIGSVIPSDYALAQFIFLATLKVF